MNRTGRTALTLVVAILGLGLDLAGADDDVILRSSVTPEEAWIGQRVRLNLEVLGADGWAHITEMGEVEIPGSYVMRTESQGVRLSETIAGTTYTGQRYQLSVYCQRPGRMEVPALPVTVKVRQWGFKAPEKAYELTTPATALVCKVPPGAEGLRGLISTTRLEADQSWSSRPGTAAPGDAIARTVTLSAADVSGMAFPPMQHSDIEGVGLYPGQPLVADVANRGALLGRREESVTYVFEQPGEVELPGLALSWWDIDAERLRRIELPGLELEVVGELAPPPADEETPTPVEEPRDRRPLVVVAAALVVLGLWLGRGLEGRLRVWRQARRESEPTYFRQVNAALRGGDPVKITGAVMRWLDRLDTETRPARLGVFLDRHGDDDTRATAAVLACCVATDERFSEARSLGRGLRRARRRHHQARRQLQKAATVLPELNIRHR